MTDKENIDKLGELLKEFEVYGDLDGIQDIRPYMKALENMLNRNKELEEENKNLKTKYNKYGRVLFTPEAIAEKHIPKSKIKEIRDKAEVMDYYTLPDVIDDLNKLLEGK